MTRIILKLIILAVVSLEVKNEIIHSLSSGMGYIQEQPVMIPYTSGRIPITSVSLYGLNNFNASISICDEYDNIIFIYFGMQRDIHYSLLIASLETGFRIFEFGEEIYFHKTEINEVAKIYVSEPGLSNVVMYENEPIWAFYDYLNLTNHNFKTIGGLDLPATLGLDKKDGYTIQNNDFLMISGELVNDTKFIKVQLNSEVFVVVDLTLSLKQAPFLKMSTIQNDEEMFIDESDVFNVIETNIFTIHLVCELAGWRVYVNGLEIHYFYHRLPFQSIRNVVLSGDGWKARTFSHRHAG